RAPVEGARSYGRALVDSVLPDHRLVMVGQGIEADAFGPQPLDAAARAQLEAVLEQIDGAVQR
ncbi:MAG: hypothetical protein M3N68_02460, partial [Actinomycetota bacterium]|nr:hypothetical protein [Actinomycetota bacterium]